MYAVIEFSPDQGGGLSLVNKTWLTRKKEVFWPPYKDQSLFNKSVKKGEEINTETWRIYNIQKIYYETDDFDKAVAKLKEAEDTSDVQTDHRSNDVSLNRKRKIIRPAKYSSSEEDEESRQLPAPPPVNRALFKATPLSRNTNQPLVREEDEIFEIAAVPMKNNAANALSTSDKSVLQVLLENIVEVKNQNKIIISKLSKLEAAEHTKTLPEEIPVKLPVKTIEDFQILDNYLQEKNNLVALTSYYSGLGGNTINSKTNRILKNTLEDSLAVFFNFYGRTNKRSFAASKLSSCIIEAVKSSSGCSNAEVEGGIKVWLKHATQRLKRKHVNNESV